MKSLRIEICNERLLPRFGVDRFLLILGRKLSQSGHQVSFSALRCDRAMLEPIATNISILEIPPGLDMVGTETAVLQRVRSTWAKQAPEIIVIGGWPFFSTAAHAETLGSKSIFIDAGAVPHDGIPDLHLPVQLELRRIRQLTLPLIDRVLAISDFIRASQTEADRGSSAGVRTVLLGADHLAQGAFSGDAGGEDLVQRMNALTRNGENLILLLGRFERTGYKNSASAFDLLRKLRGHIPCVRLLLLDSGQDCGVPEDLRGAVEMLGAPDDHTLQNVMSQCAAGVSMSLWEGYNLPLAEMQWLGKPAFAFNIGAHPEVVADPWLLCDSLEEMTQKLASLMEGKAPIELEARFAAFRRRHRWNITLDSWEQEIHELASSPRLEVDDRKQQHRRIVLVDVTNSSADPANPGVVRVTRRLCSWLQRFPTLELVFGAWHPETATYTFLNHTRRKFLESFGGPKDGLGLLATSSREISLTQYMEALGMSRLSRPILFMPEVMFDGQAGARRDWAKKHGYASAAILYDLIPVLHQGLCGANVSAGFPAYLEALVTMNAVWSISRHTLDDFKRYVAQAGLTLPPAYEAIQLPGQFGDLSRRNGGSGRRKQQEIRILCVSTLEPRKNHLRLVEAFQKLRENRPDLSLRLVLVGNQYASSPEIVQNIQAASQRDPAIQWVGIIDDERLADEYCSATFTVYPSLIEGFGLPILESLWMGRPCLTHNQGVMHELAEDGGCVATDMTDVDTIERELERLATDETLISELTQSASKREISNWEGYATELADRLARL